ncbi:hypothetical protein GCM10011359_09780 [Nesterenkonia alkaliphila]|nr:hypothetical protein GCM10011359_09780 [Nesterenkonia alkaliphila]
MGLGIFAPPWCLPGCGRRDFRPSHLKVRQRPLLGGSLLGPGPARRVAKRLDRESYVLSITPEKSGQATVWG